ncbi:hypothetical protein GCM10027059_21100 [Myceligenerans halotolerans]
MTDPLTAVLDAVRPYPEDGSRADGPVAVDATDRLVLDEARGVIASAGPGEVVTIGDRFGALTLGALGLGAREVRAHQDPVDAEAALRANAFVAQLGSFEHRSLGPELLGDARVVLLQLPKSLAELAEIAERVARHAADDVVLYAGGRVKHMTHAMNDVLGACFSEVTPSLARRKSRLLVARGPRPGVRERPLTYPAREVLPDVPGFTGPVTVVTHGGVFAGGTLDGGTRFLLEQAGGWPASGSSPTLDGWAPSPGGRSSSGSRRSPSGGGPMADDGGAGAASRSVSVAPREEDPRSLSASSENAAGRDDGRGPHVPARKLAVDLGCGSGILAIALALRGFQVVATDRSAAAVASTDATAAANGVGPLVRTVRDDAGASLPDECADLVLINPPFHDRAAVSTDAAHRMFATAGRTLRPGGELWTVFNSALRYRPALERAVGPTEQIARDRRFTVTRSTRPA